MGYYLGVDTGGTKSHALVVNENGDALGYGHGGSGNHEIVGYDGVEAVLKQITGRALAMAGVKAEEITGAGFGIAGYDWPSERQPTLEVIGKLGLVKAKIDACNDTLIGVLAGTKEGWGIAVDSGTGNNCWGRDRRGKTGQVTGCGTMMAEEGGASEMIYNAIRAISREWSMRGPKTMLTTLFIQEIGAKDTTDFLEGLLLERYHLNQHIAPLVFEAARAGDAVAGELVRHTGESLGDLVCGVARQLNLEDEAFEVVEIGSMFESGALLEEPLRQYVLQYAPKATFIRLTAPPVTGGVLLGMEHAGIQIAAIRDRVIKSAEAAWKKKL